jgi:RNA polymerase sigma factor (sigma-70 family)
LDEVLDFSPERSGELIALDDTLKALERFGPHQSHIVELRFFGGLSVEESGEVVGASATTVKRDWKTARAWPRGELTRQGARW